MWAVRCWDHIILLSIASVCVSGSSSIWIYRRKCPLSLRIPVYSSQLLRDQIIPPRTSVPSQSRQIPPRLPPSCSQRHLSFSHPPYSPPQIHFASFNIRPSNRTSNSRRSNSLLQYLIQTIPHPSRIRPRIQTPL